MLDDIRKMYQACADLYVPNWESINKNLLFDLYIDNENNKELSNGYLSAIFCTYWSLLSKYLSLSYNVATEDDVYEWLLNSVMYTLKHRSWRNPNSSIYKDPNGPDKMINRCMKCRRLTFYQAINRKKRKDGVMMYSLDKIKDDFNDSTDSLQDFSTDELEEDCIILNEYIRNLFCSNDELVAFMLDIIANYEVFKVTKDGSKEFSLNKLIKLFMHSDSVYFEQFATKYKLDVHTVEQKFNMLYNSNTEQQLEQKISDKFATLEQLSYFEGCKYVKELSWM